MIYPENNCGAELYDKSFDRAGSTGVVPGMRLFVVSVVFFAKW